MFWTANCFPRIIVYVDSDKSFEQTEVLIAAMRLVSSVDIIGVGIR